MVENIPGRGKKDDPLLEAMRAFDDASAEKKILPKEGKDPVRINLPPKPTRPPTIKLPTLPPQPTNKPEGVEIKLPPRESGERKIEEESHGLKKYSYVAMDHKGIEFKGVLKVSNLSEAINRVKEMGLFSTKIVEVGKDEIKETVKEKGWLARYWDKFRSGSRLRQTVQATTAAAVLATGIYGANRIRENVGEGVGENESEASSVKRVTSENTIEKPGHVAPPEEDLSATAKKLREEEEKRLTGVDEIKAKIEQKLSEQAIASSNQLEQVKADNEKRLAEQASAFSNQLAQIKAEKSESVVPSKPAQNNGELTIEQIRELVEKKGREVRSRLEEKYATAEKAPLTDSEKIQAIREKLNQGKKITADEAAMHNLALMRKPSRISTGQTIQTGTMPKPPSGYNYVYNPNPNRVNFNDSTRIYAEQKIQNHYNLAPEMLRTAERVHKENISKLFSKVRNGSKIWDKVKNKNANDFMNGKIKDEYKPLFEYVKKLEGTTQSLPYLEENVESFMKRALQLAVNNRALDQIILP